MLSVYMAVRVRPFPKLPPLEQNGCGPSTLISPAQNAKASPRLTPCHWKAPPPPFPPPQAGEGRERAAPSVHSRRRD